MHVKILQISALLLQLVVETMLDAIITQKKLTTQKLHRNHIDPIEQSTDEPVLELLLNVAHADQEILLLNMLKTSKADSRASEPESF